MTASSPRYARAFVEPVSSPIRALLQYANRPGTVSFAGGYPDPVLFDVDGLRQASEQVNLRLGAHLQYSGTEGQASLRRALARLSASRGIVSDPDTEVVVTGGSQQAMTLIARVMLEAGDSVVIESPSFPTSVQALVQTGARVLTVPSGEDGIDLDALEVLLRTEQPKMICLVATFSNPSGSTLSRERRKRLIRMAQAHRVVVVEDDPYSGLRYRGDAVPPLFALAEGDERNWVVYLSSLSKTVAPALRLGWLVASPELRRRCVSAKQADDLSVSPWMQEIAADYLDAGGYERHLPTLLQAYGARCQAMIDGLQTSLAGQVRYRAPEGGMFVWARFNPGVRASEVLQKAIEREVVFVPGSAFYPDPKALDEQAFRLSFASAPEQEITQGMQRLGQALRDIVR